MSKRSNLDLAIELLNDERRPLMQKLEVIDLAIRKLEEQRDVTQKPKKGPRAVSEKAS